jgi:hypothetical protein
LHPASAWQAFDNREIRIYNPGPDHSRHPLAPAPLSTSGYSLYGTDLNIGFAFRRRDFETLQLPIAQNAFDN